MANKKIKVACYGSLKRNFSNHCLLQQDGVTFLGEDKTAPEFTMYSLGGFPAVKREGNTPIAIEVFEVTEEVKQDLDGLEGYRGEGQNNLYNVDTIQTKFGEATIYVFNREAMRYPKVESGVWEESFLKH